MVSLFCLTPIYFYHSLLLDVAIFAYIVFFIQICQNLTKFDFADTCMLSPQCLLRVNNRNIDKKKRSGMWTNANTSVFVWRADMTFHTFSLCLYNDLNASETFQTKTDYLKLTNFVLTDLINKGFAVKRIYLVKQALAESGYGKKKKMWLSQGTTESTTKALKLTNNSYREKTQPNRNLNAFKLTKVDFILQQQVQYHPPTNSHRPESIRYIVYTASIGIGICIGIGYIPNLLLLAYLACKHFQCWKPKSNVSRRATTPNWANHMTIHAIDKIHHTNGKCPLRHKRTHEIPFCTQWLFLVIYFCLPSSVLLKDKPNAIRRQFFYHPILIAMP